MADIFSRFNQKWNFFESQNMFTCVLIKECLDICTGKQDEKKKLKAVLKVNIFFVLNFLLSRFNMHRQK